MKERILKKLVLLDLFLCAVSLSSHTPKLKVQMNRENKELFEQFIHEINIVIGDVGDDDYASKKHLIDLIDEKFEEWIKKYDLSLERFC